MNTGYDTAYGQVYDQSKLLKTIKTEMLHGSIGLQNIGEVDNIHVLGVTHCDDFLDVFTQPLYLNDYAGSKVLVDLRQVVKVKEDQVKISNKAGYATLRGRGMLTAHWISGNYGVFKGQGKLAGQVLCHTIAMRTGKTYNLDSVQIVKISALVSLYYDSLFDQLAMTEEETIEGLMKFSFIEPKLAKEMVNDFKMIKDLDTLAEAIVKVIDSIKIRKFNRGVLLTMLVNITWGNNANEDIAIAIEYPPLWSSLVYTALTDMSYRKTYLSIQAKQVGRKSAKGFILAMNELQELD